MDNKNESVAKANEFIVEAEELIDHNFSGIGYEMFHHMKKYSKNIAQYHMPSGREQRYESILQKSIRVAVNLKSRKLKEDAIIGICASNGMDTCIPIISSQFLGYKVVAYDCLLAQSDLALVLMQIPSSVIFVDEQYVENVESAIRSIGAETELIVFGKSSRYEVFDQCCVASEDDTFQPVKLNSGKNTAIIMCSSGTTGVPKGICLSHDSLLKQAIHFNLMQNINENTVFLHFAPYNWITAQIILIATTLSGSSRVLSSISSGLEAIYKYKVTHVLTSPYLSSVLMDKAKPEPLKNRSVKSFITAGSKIEPQLLLNLRNSFQEALIIESYGQTEATGWITLFQWHKEEDRVLATKHPDSVGKLFPGFRGKVVDMDTGKILGPNQVGELRLNSKDFHMNGYYKKDASDNFDAEGWLKTGDLVYYDENCCFYIVGRCKEMLTYRDFHISPQKLEIILESHPAVEKAVVVGIPHPIDEYHVRGIIKLKDDHESTSAEQIKSFVDDQVEERLKLHGGVQIVETLPITSTGKVNRRLLKEMMESGKL